MKKRFLAISILSVIFVSSAFSGTGYEADCMNPGISCPGGAKGEGLSSGIRMKSGPPGNTWSFAGGAIDLYPDRNTGQEIALESLTTHNLVLPISHDRLRPETAQIDENGLLSIADDHNLYVTDPEGQWLFTCTLPQSFGLAGYARLSDGYYWIVGNFQEDTPEGDLQQRLFVFDEQGTKLASLALDKMGLASAFPNETQGLPAYLRQIFGSGNLMYATFWIPTGFRQGAELIAELGFDVNAGLTAEKIVGTRIVADRAAAYKQAWITGGDVPYILSQMVRQLRPLTEEMGAVPLTLHQERASLNSASKDNTEARKHSSTLISGLFQYEQNLIIGYQSPNLNHPWYGGREDNEPASIQYIQMLDRNNRDTGYFAALPGAHLVGVSQGVIYTLHADQSQHATTFYLKGSYWPNVHVVASSSRITKKP